MPKLVDDIRSHVLPAFGCECVAHDIQHLDRVHSLAMQIQEAEGGDGVVVGAACYLHDFHRVAERRGEDDHAVEGHIRSALAAVAFPEHKIPAVLDCVAFTDQYSFSGDSLADGSVEARIVRDADNLDAMGAIGVARAFMFGGTLGEPLWANDIHPNQSYRPGPTASILHHFLEKLLRIRDDMLTDRGKILAADRHDFMVEFVDQLRNEWDAPGLDRAFAKMTSVHPSPTGAN